MNNTDGNRTFQNVLRELLQKQHARNMRLFTEQDSTKCRIDFDVVTLLQTHTHELTHALLERAAMFAMHRTGCKSAQEMKQAHVDMIADDVDQAWTALLMERQ